MTTFAGKKGFGALPSFDSLPVEPSEIDLVLITHFHIDHCASLPYLTEKIAGFNAEIYMTHATKAVMSLIVADYLDLGAENLEFSKSDLSACLDKIQLIDFHQTKEVKGIKFTAFAAGHVLGAAMFQIELDGVKILYTGDYSMEEDRHLKAATVPKLRPDVLIVESTYGVQCHNSREERESRFTGTVDAIVRSGGKCLIPVFALGRAQELLLILDEHWQNTPEIQKIPVFYASQLAAKALRVYQTFINMMNDYIASCAEVYNPFHFKYIRNIRDASSLDESGNISNPFFCVVHDVTSMYLCTCNQKDLVW